MVFLYLSICYFCFTAWMSHFYKLDASNRICIRTLLINLLLLLCYCYWRRNEVVATYGKYLYPYHILPYMVWMKKFIDTIQNTFHTNSLHSLFLYRSTFFGNQWIFTLLFTYIFSFWVLKCTRCTEMLYLGPFFFLSSGFRYMR